jgi:archaetidylinositol phosphate synthase
LVSSNLKKQFEAATKALVKPLSKIGLTPNHITILGVLVALITAWFYIKYVKNPIMLIYAGLTILLSGLLDAIDGVLARTTNKVSRFGGFFDSVSDRYSDLITISGIIISGLSDPLTGLAALIGTVMVSYTRARAEAEGVNMTGVGFAERAERMIFLAACSIASYFWLDALKWGLLLLAIITHITIIQRAIYFKKEAEKV